MSNRSAIITIMTTLDAIDVSLRGLELDVSSRGAEIRVGRALAYVRCAKLELAIGLQHSVDPVLDLTCGTFECLAV